MEKKSGRRANNFFNFQSGERLPMSAAQAIAFATFFLENDDFFAPALVGDLGHDFDILKDGLADADVVAIGQQEHFSEIDSLANFTVQFFHPQHIAASHLILLAACSHYRIHAQTLVIFRRKAVLRIRANSM
jgi:hypothetical protein